MDSRLLIIFSTHTWLMSEGIPFSKTDAYLVACSGLSFSVSRSMRGETRRTVGCMSSFTARYLAQEESKKVCLTDVQHFFPTTSHIFHASQRLLSSDVVRAANRISISDVDGHYDMIQSFVIHLICFDLGIKAST